MLSAFSQAWASWKTAPGVALLAVVAFAVGIGSATAIFTVVNGVLLRPLPYPDAERFVLLSGARTTEPGIFWTMSVPELHDYQYPGDVLLSFTDGVPEAHNAENEEFGEERLQQLLRQTAHLPADEISARISAEMKNWIRDAEQYDDLTFIVMKVR